MQNLFQFAGVDIGVILLVSTDLVTNILPRAPESR